MHALEGDIIFIFHYYFCCLYRKPWSITTATAWRSQDHFYFFIVVVVGGGVLPLSLSLTFFYTFITFYLFPLIFLKCEYRKRITIYNLLIRFMLNFFAIWKIAEQKRISFFSRSLSSYELFHLFECVTLFASTLASFISWCLSYYSYTHHTHGVISFAAIISF